MKQLNQILLRQIAYYGPQKGAVYNTVYYLVDSIIIIIIIIIIVICILMSYRLSFPSQNTVRSLLYAVVGRTKFWPKNLRIIEVTSAYTLVALK